MQSMKQLTIVSENRKNLVAEITEKLAEANINIETIDAKTYGNNSVVVLSVDKYDLALQNLNQLPNCQIITEDAILIRLKDEPGALAKIARRFTDADIGMRSIRFIQRNQNYGLVAISVERTDEAMELVKDVLVS